MQKIIKYQFMPRTNTKQKKQMLKANLEGIIA